MYRVIFPIAIVMMLPACSLGTTQLGFGYNANPSDRSTSPNTSFAPDNLALGGEPASRRPRKSRRVAALDDRAPSGSFERAPRGALADRDYSSTALIAEEAKQLINDYRRQHGLRPLKLEARLTEAARNHSRDLAKWDRISHYGSDGSNPWDRVKRTGYTPRIAAENVGTGQSSFKEVLKGWKESSGHNKNLLLKDANHMGIALVKAPKTEFKTFWTLVLGARH